MVLRVLGGLFLVVVMWVYQVCVVWEHFFVSWRTWGYCVFLDSRKKAIG